LLVADSATQRACQALHKGDPIRVEGRLWLSRWTGVDGKEQTGLSCAAKTVERITEKTEQALIEAQAVDPPRRRQRRTRRDWQSPLHWDETRGMTDAV
jgi:single-stranded DNA-binding protein